MASISLRERTLELVRNRPIHQSGRKICEATGLSPSWLTAFTQGKLAEPGVDKVQALYEYLTGKPLLSE